MGGRGSKMKVRKDFDAEFINLVEVLREQLIYVIVQTSKSAYRWKTVMFTFPITHEKIV